MLANRVRELTTTTGTGDISLGGAMAGHVGFSSVFEAGDMVTYVIEDGDNYEIGTGTLVDTDTLERTAVLEAFENGVYATSGAQPISLGGNARVYCAVTSQFLLSPAKTADILIEATEGAGVTIEDVLMKDGVVSSTDAAPLVLAVDDTPFLTGMAPGIAALPGPVGLGVSNPQELLHLGADGGAATMLIQRTNPHSTGFTFGDIDWQDSDAKLRGRVLVRADDTDADASAMQFTVTDESGSQVQALSLDHRRGSFAGDVSVTSKLGIGGIAATSFGYGGNGAHFQNSGATGLRLSDTSVTRTTEIFQSGNDFHIDAVNSGTNFILSPSGKVEVTSLNPELSLVATSADQFESGRIRLTENQFQGGYIHYDGFANQLKIGTHNAVDSDPANDIDAILIARGSGKLTFPATVQIGDTGTTQPVLSRNAGGGLQVESNAAVASTNYLFQITENGTDRFSIDGNGDALFAGNVLAEGLIESNRGGNALLLKPGPFDHVYMSFYADSETPTVRSAFVGYGSAGQAAFSIKNEMVGGRISLATAGGTGLTVESDASVTFSGQVINPATVGTIGVAGGSGAADLSKAAFLAGSTSFGVGIDSNEIAAMGTPLHFGTNTDHDLLIYRNGAVALAFETDGAANFTGQVKAPWGSGYSFDAGDAVIKAAGAGGGTVLVKAGDGAKPLQVDDYSGNTALLVDLDLSTTLFGDLKGANFFNRAAGSTSIFSGGDAYNKGANLLMRGNGHADAGDMQLRVDAVAWGTFDHSAATFTLSPKIVGDGGAKISLMNKVDGGSSHGLYLWDTDTTDWGLYMAQAGASKSMASGSACAALDGRTGFHARIRIDDFDSTLGLLVENASEQCLLSLAGDTGDLYTKGKLNVGGSTFELGYQSSNAAINGLLGGSSHFGLIEGPASGHMVIGIRGNDTADSFAVVGISAGNPYTYDKTLFSVDAAGDAAFYRNIGSIQNIIRGTGASSLIVSGGGSTSLGGRLKLYGQSHATHANDIEFVSGNAIRSKWDDSASVWDFQNTNLSRVNNLVRGTDTDNLHLSGGEDTNTGANIELRGGTTGIDPNDISFRTGTIVRAKWDHGASVWDFQNQGISNAAYVSVNGDILRTTSDGELRLSGDTAGTMGGNLTLFGAAHGGNPGGLRYRSGTDEIFSIDGATHAAIFDGDVTIEGETTLNSILYMNAGIDMTGHNVSNVNILDVDDEARLNGLLKAAGGAKISVQDVQDGGADRGIYMWESTNHGHVIYEASSGAGLSPSGDTPCTSLDGRTGLHMRARLPGSVNYGFLWEKSSEECLMSLTADTGELYVLGRMHCSVGTVGAPAITSRDTLDTGMLFPAAEEIAFATNGVGRVYLSNSVLNLYVDLAMNGQAISGVGKITATDVIQPLTDTSANRPSASAAGAGAMMFDTTLDRPIWSNGSAWVDASGTVV